MVGGDAASGGPRAEQPAVPPSVLRSWDEAEARLFPLVMAQPELYQQALGAVQQLLGRLRETCPPCSPRTNAAAICSTAPKCPGSGPP